MRKKCLSFRIAARCRTDGDIHARNLLDLVALLRTHMDAEERNHLDERVIRDDVVGIEVETG